MVEVRNCTMLLWTFRTILFCLMTGVSSANDPIHVDYGKTFDYVKTLSNSDFIFAVLKEFLGLTSIFTCAIKCKQDPFCESFSYESKGFACRLFAKRYMCVNSKIRRHENTVYYIKRVGDDPEVITEALDCTKLKASECQERYYLCCDESDGVYPIYPNGPSQPSEDMYCLMKAGGWTAFQRRTTGALSFYRGWADYKAGFGSVHGEFWLGNDKIHALTSDGKYELRVDVSDFDDLTAFAEFGTFSVGNETMNYVLEVTDYSANSTAGNSLEYHNGMEFSTNDRDNDRAGHSCAVAFRGAWWYDGCHASNLNGMYLAGSYSTTTADGVVWRAWRELQYSLKTCSMAYRRKYLKV